MQPMETAPRDRMILIALGEGYDKDAYIVAKYRQLDKTGPYKEVWEMGPGEFYQLDDKALIGWWDLPEKKK